MIIRLNTQVNNLETIYIFQLSFLFDDFDDYFSCEWLEVRTNSLLRVHVELLWEMGRAILEGR